MQRSSRKAVAGTIVLLILLVLFVVGKMGPTTQQVSTKSFVASPTPETFHLGTRTKTIDCTVNGALPDTGCTPATVFPAATVQEICTPGYSSSVRDVPVAEKNAVYAEYGIGTHTKGQHEVDHLISLELGGSNDIANLWPEAAEPRPGFHEKDKVENYLHEQVCTGGMPLTRAQQEIATQWLSVYQQLP